MTSSQIKTCRIDTGDWVGSAWRGPELTPYADAIAEKYPFQIPYYLTMRQQLTLAVVAVTQTPFVQTTRPLQYDCLILGMSALITGDTEDDNGNCIYLQVTDMSTGIPWVAPSLIGYAPVGAFAGINADPDTGAFFPMPLMKLPEAFFLPRHTQLKLEWFPLPESLIVTPNLNVRLTMIGIQLIGGAAPKEVTMPNGDVIPVGSRLPWFGCVPFGRKSILPGSSTLQGIILPPGEEATQFLPPIDCNVEIHDAYANFLAQSVTPATDKTVFKLKMTEMRSSALTSELAPAPAIFGNEEQVYPALPFVKPHLVKSDHRIGLIMLNNSPIDLTLNRATVTLRGVRLCEY